MYEKPLLNYTTNPMRKTADEIVGILARHGCESVTQTYEDGEISGIAFVFPIKGPSGTATREFKMPINVDDCWRVMRRQNAAGVIADTFASHEQAKRTAWRITKDWIDAQLALLATEMTRLETIFLPFMVADEDGRTVFEILDNRGFKLPAIAASSGEGEPR